MTLRHFRSLAILSVLAATVMACPVAAQQVAPDMAPVPLRQPQPMYGWPTRPGQPVAMMQGPAAPTGSGAMPEVIGPPQAAAGGRPQSMPLPPGLPAGAEAATTTSIIHQVTGKGDKLDMTVNSSRILTMDQKIPQVQVNNPDILDLTPLSPTQIQVAAKKPGVTQINLWGENKQIYTVDVTVVGDAKELTMILQTQFPKTALKVFPVGTGLLITGYVDNPDEVHVILDIAKEYSPRIINYMNVSGGQLLVLHTKVMEVSRTKLRKLGFDFAKINNANLFVSQVSGLIGAVTGGSITINNTPTVQFNIGNANSAFFGVMDALRQDSLAKILAEPNVVALSGRPAYFQVGGEFGYQVSGGVSGPTVMFKEYGTRIDMVAFVLGNGRIHLDVRPSVSAIDNSLSVGGIPALKTRVTETGVEMKAGQTLAIAGLVQNFVESENSGLPWISEVPYLGMPFRHVSEEINEVETLIMVTPEFVDAMDPGQVPPCGPGMETTSPSDWELFFKGHLEVPICCSGNQAHCGNTAVVRADGTAATRPAEAAAVPTVEPYNRYTPPSTTDYSKPAHGEAQSEPLPFIGPIGYDVIK